MSFQIHGLPRGAFCWLNETKVVVLSLGNQRSQCILLDTVSKPILTASNHNHFKSTNISSTISVDGSFIYSVAKM